jgi:hypothetical protein
VFTSIKKLHQYLNAIQNGNPDLDVFVVEKDSHLIEAQRLHASVYLRYKYISASDVLEDGRIDLNQDPYQEHSLYFVVAENTSAGEKVVATARQIFPKPKIGHNSFPLMSKLPIYPEARSQLMKLEPNDYVEISALAKAKGYSSYAVLLLYRAMWHYSIAKNHKAWLMACDSSVYSRLKFLFGPALTEIGDETYYMGSNVIPAMLEIDQSVEFLLRKPKYINVLRRKLHIVMRKFFLTGLDPKFYREKLH